MRYTTRFNVILEVVFIVLQTPVKLFLLSTSADPFSRFLNTFQLSMLPHCQCVNIALKYNFNENTTSVLTLQNQLNVLSVPHIYSFQYSHRQQVSNLRFISVKTQAFVPSALKSRQMQKVYDIPNTLKDNQSPPLKMERLLKTDLQHEPVVVLVCPVCDPTGDNQKFPAPLIFVIAEFLSFINATPEYEPVFAEINSVDWKTPLADGTAAISMPLILDGGAINYHPTKLKFFLGITFVTALPKAMEYSTL
ncbi:unnamed protein product, partial [Allacma fusca]